MSSTSTSIEQLPCELTPEEILRKSREMTQLAREKAVLVEQKKQVASEMKNQIADKDAQINKLINEVHTGEELRPIECFERPNYADNVVHLVRTDTAEIVRTRGMHPSERQTALLEDMGELPPKSRGRPKRKTPASDESTH